MDDLVTQAEAYAHLYIDADSNGSPHDMWLSIFIPAISEAVRDWLKDEWRLYEWETDADGKPVVGSSGDPITIMDSSGNPTVRWAVKAAVLVELASQFRYREGEGDNIVPSHEGHGYSLSRGAIRLLTPLRKPTVAAAGGPANREGHVRGCGCVKCR